MAIYHFSAKVISRSGGRSSVAAAAYRSAGQMRDNRQGLDHDYSRKTGVVRTEVLAPANAPEWMRDRNQLWNAVEVVEKRKDAQLAREIEISLPRELDWDQRWDLLNGFVQREFVNRGMIADVALHDGKARDGKKQPHAHVMLTMRELMADGFGKKERKWNETDLLLGWRKGWERDANSALERAGLAERIDHRSLDAQRLEAERKAEQALENEQHGIAIQNEKKVIELSREPEPKIGPIANAMEKRGIQTERGDEYRAAKLRNHQRRELGWKQLELKLKERGLSMLAAAHKELEQLWGRAERAMSKIRDRFIDTVGRSPSDDLDQVKKAVPGPGERKPQMDQNQEVSRQEDLNRQRRDKILGRVRPESEQQDRDPQDVRNRILGRHEKNCPITRKRPERGR